ncbi:uncharacterized protein KQ657_004544 [Scheffersomyces spartinae]|uniref:Regulator of phospholipase D SRF1 n=1 Tax=Scheffersomyces spartinae TaxID=45513 RepID=A0A9P7VAK4_9ASCO|nr:uncharacterized protein KQ657_004544 [Scheffersomyces spartinae]KAG7194332.1 hypothetical protein KQ657_004544 [Scheffersomyces spartinae]
MSSNGNYSELESRPRTRALLDPVSIKNPFEHSTINAYGHTANIVPPFVLDTLTYASNREQKDTGARDVNVDAISNQRSNKEDRRLYASSANMTRYATDNNTLTTAVTEDAFGTNEDEYIKTIDDTWHKFLASVTQPSGYDRDVVTFETKRLPDLGLDKEWGGDHRLKLALVGSSSQNSSDEDKDDRDYFLCFPFFRKPRKSKDFESDSPKVRSRAGYWMSNEKRKIVIPTLQRMFLLNPMVPLILRVVIIILVGTSLGMAITIFQFSNNRIDAVAQQPSTIMAIVVQCFALAYLIYIAYDEYSGKPLGLRNPMGKMKLILLDLLFIIFSAANLALAFNTLYDDKWACVRSNSFTKVGVPSGKIGSLCRRQRAMVSFLFMILCFWCLTFTISITRVVVRVSGVDDIRG